MGHREDLLAAAKRCLYEKGYARITARDLVAASGANLASIGYHYGSKEALLIRAVIEATGEWGDELARVLSEKRAGLDAMEQFQFTWTKVIELFAAHRQLWAAQFGVLAQIEHEPALRAIIAEATGRARLGLAELLGGIDPAQDLEKALEVGSYYYALLVGVMAQHVIDPGTAPTGPALARTLRTVTTDLGLTAT